MSNRDISIDAVKGFCMICVVFGHSPNNGLLGDALFDFVQILYTFHVPIFAIISGWFSVRREGHWGDFVVVFRKLTVPYLIVGFLFLALYSFAQSFGIPTTIKKTTALGIVSGCGAGGALWYLYYLMIYQFSVLAAKAISRKVGISGQTASFVPLVLGGFLAWIALRALGHHGLVYFFLFFFIGYYLHLVVDRLEGNVLFFVIAFATYCLFDVPRASVPNVIWVLSLLLGLLGLFRANCMRHPTKFLSVVGERTMAILLFHPLFIIPVKLVGKSVLDVEPSGIALKIIATAFSIAACICVDKFAWEPIKAKLTRRCS